MKYLHNIKSDKIRRTSSKIRSLTSKKNRNIIILNIKKIILISIISTETSRNSR